LAVFDKTVVHPIQGLIFDMSGGRFKADGCTFVIPKDQTTRAFRAVFLSDSYEANERSLVREFVRPTDSVIELGGCLGIVSCLTNKRLADKTRHLVVEGNPFCISTLHRNRDINGCGFLIENCAVSNQCDATFYLHPAYIDGGATQRETNRPVRVPARSLTELDTRYGPFTTLVIDVEGAELDVFQHSRDQLRRYRLIIAELHAWAIGEEGVKQCQAILAEAGLRFQRRAVTSEAWQRD
jgi:FkbM family methyltransferase